MHQQDAVSERDRGPRMFGRDDRDLGRSDLDRLGIHAHGDTAFQNVKRHRATLIVLVERGPGAERDEHEPEGSGLGQRAAIPIAHDIFLLGTQSGGFFDELEMRERNA
jgi:hypothetical protein